MTDLLTHEWSGLAESGCLFGFLSRGGFRCGSGRLLHQLRSGHGDDGEPLLVVEPVVAAFVTEVVGFGEETALLEVEDFLLGEGAKFNEGAAEVDEVFHSVCFIRF